MATQIKVVIAGPRGRMGSEAVKMVLENTHFQLVGLVDHKNDGKSLDQIFTQYPKNDVYFYTDMEECLQITKPDVLVDLTVPEVAFHHITTALNYGVRPVVGTTGLSVPDLEEIKRISTEKEIGCIIAPNFAVGAVLMMKFSQMAAKFFNDVEIIELHHDKKLDAPSGTAVKTAQMIQSVRASKKQGHPNESEKLPGARGAEFDGMHIHSVRLPGLVAHQEVLFGSNGETLTIRHDSYNRESFMTGIKISIETVMNLHSYVYGLENILD